MAGFYTYINGTSYDVLNSMGFNFIVDYMYLGAGSGSKSYDGYPSMNLTPSDLLFSQTSGSKSFTFSQNGNTINWNTDVDRQVIVTATPTSAAPYTGFQFYNPDGTVKIAPNFTPFVLCQVADFTPQKGQVFETVVPESYTALGFVRSTNDGLSRCLMERATQNGKQAFRFTFADGSTPIRLYVFSRFLVNTPSGGFFMYWNDRVVWHSNCLPLQMESTDGGLDTDYPTAVISSIGGNNNISMTPGYFDQLFLATAAGMYSGKYRCSKVGWEYIHTFNNRGAAPSGWSINRMGYIDCRIYDQYYKNALGY